MYVSKEILINSLPAYSDNWVKIKDKQEVNDIIKLILSRHKDFAADYDLIAPYFIGSTIDETCENLFQFCKKNIIYFEETENFQSVPSPSAILHLGKGDCKFYALFIGGCLDAIGRYTGNPIDWRYCFASYELLQKIPYHVFVVVDVPGEPQMYVDPTPGADGKEPVWIICERVHTETKTRAAVNSLGNLIYQPIGCVDSLHCDCDTIGAAASYGTLLTPPAWYPAYLPKFYRDANKNIIARPINAVPNYTENDICDLLLYCQTIVGFNRVDWQNQHLVATRTNWTWAISLFKSDGNGNGGGNWDQRNTDIDETIYKKMQNRFVVNETPARPYVSAINATGMGIDLLTLPYGSDAELTRPSWYPAHLPSLFVSTGQPYQMPAGNTITKIRIRGYNATASDIAYFFMLAQPLVSRGPNPYPMNWVYGAEITGANCCKFFISLGAFQSFSNDAQSAGVPQTFYGYSIAGSVMQLPPQPIPQPAWITAISAATIAILKKIPVLGTAYAVLAPVVDHMNAGNQPPAGSFSAAVNEEAAKIVAANTATAAAATKKKNYLLFALIAGGALLYYYRDDLNL